MKEFIFVLMKVFVRKIAVLFLLSIYLPSYAWEVISDGKFRRGFVVSPLTSAEVEAAGSFQKVSPGTLVGWDKKQSPCWHLCQWNSRFNMMEDLQIKRKGKRKTFTLANQSKLVRVDKNGTLWLEVNASKEYLHPRTEQEPWVHLLIEQNFERCPRVGEAKALNFKMQLKLEKAEKRMNDVDFDTRIHTAQSPFYFVLRNANRQSKDFNQYIWFGLPSYDYRYPFTDEREIISWDVGTHTYIYNVPTRTVWGNVTFVDHLWHSVDMDLLPLIIKAVSRMKEKGHFLATELKDLELHGMNFGWEVPGTFDVAVSIKGLSLEAKDK